MRALVLDEGGLHVVRDRVEPAPAEGEVVVRVLRAGICGTDLELLRGYRGFHGVPGHEFVGVVERGCGCPEWETARVVGEINVACGRCATCAAGTTGHCAARRVLGIAGRDGAFAEFVRVPLANLHRVPDDVSDDEAVFVEPLAAACRIVEQVPVGPERRVVVVGAGRLGILCAQVLRLTGCRVEVLGRHPENHAVLVRQGIPASVSPDEIAAGADVVVDATGTPDGLAVALDLVRPLGTIVLKSTCAGDDAVPAEELARVVVNEVTVVGSRCGPFRRALQLLQDRLVDVEPLVHARYSLERAHDAFEHAARPGVLKVLLDVA